MSFSIIVSLTVNELAFASHDSSESKENIQAGCREGNVLVFRLSSHEYLCTSTDTAKRWAELGLAEIMQNATIQSPETPITGIQVPKTEQTQIKNNPINDNSKCREGYTLVFRFTHKDTFCTSPSTATSWVKLGLAEIIQEATISLKNETTISKVNEEINSKNTTKIIVPNPVSPKKNVDTISNKPIISSELLTLQEYRYPPAVHRVNERIWAAVGYDSSNSVMIEGEKGIIIINTLSSYENAKKVIDEFRKITTKPVKTIIYTSANSEDTGGTKAFLEYGDGNVEIIAHDNNLNFYVKQNILLNQFTGLRNYYTSGSLLPSGDQINSKYYVPPTLSGFSYIPPTDTFSDKFNLNISGVKMNLGHVGDDTSEQIYVWLPNDQSLLIGDNLYGISPNNHALGGVEYHDPMRYVQVIDEFIPLKPQSLILSHVKPVLGTENVQDILISTRDATQYVYDQTIRGINNGYQIDEISTKIKLPPALEKHPWLEYPKEQIQWNVKQIYYGTVGWYEADAAFLHPVNLETRSFKIVNGFGGIDNTILEVKNAIKNGEYEWASELVTYVLYVDPENLEAKSLKANTLRVLSQRVLSLDARQLGLTKALELENKIKFDEKSSKLNYVDLTEIPIEKVLHTLPSKLKSEKTENVKALMSIYYPDIDKSFTLVFRNNVLIILDGNNADARYKITLDTKTHKSIITGELDIVRAIDSNKITFQGDVDNLMYLMGLTQDDQIGIPAKFKT